MLQNRDLSFCQISVVHRAHCYRNSVSELPDQQSMESFTIHPSLRTALLNVGLEGKHSHHSLELLVQKYSLPTKIKSKLLTEANMPIKTFLYVEKKAQIIQYR